MVDYWLAGVFGKLWLRLHKGLRPSFSEMPGECDLVARGGVLPAARLYRAQGFAARAWWRVCMAAIVLVFPVIGLGAAAHSYRAATDAAVGLISCLGCLAAVAALQMGLISFRSGQVRMYLRRAGPQAGAEPLPTGSLGLPARSDFWVMLVIALSAFGILAYAGLH